jgi:hypothetical protein
VTLRDFVMQLRAERVDARPYVPGHSPAMAARAGEDKVSALLALALELKKLEAELVHEALVSAQEWKANK